MQTFTIGIDFGTNSARAIVVSCADGSIVGSGVSDYHSGDHGVLTHPSDPDLARQNPADYIGSLGHAITTALAQAGANKEFSRDRIIGIGVAATGSTPLPVDAKARPLSIDPQFEGHLAAQAWLWKDHTAHAEAAAITAAAQLHAPHYLVPIGGTYSPEWWWAKVWRCLKTAPEVFDAAASWVELADFIPAVLSGVDNPRDIVRCMGAAGHKAMYLEPAAGNREPGAGGLPSKEFLARLDPKLAELRDRLYDRALPAGIPAGNLCKEWATALGLREGIVIAMGGLDAHYGAVGAGIAEGTLVKNIGTSTCDCVISANSVGDIPGICGIVKGSIIPGYYGIEAATEIARAAESTDQTHSLLTHEASLLRPGQSGLMADPKLTGLLVGMTLQTTMAEIYRALIEATAFGARAIIDRLREHGVPIEHIVCRGGIAEKNDVFMQIYADVIGRPMLIAGSPQASALGAAISAAVTAGEFDSWTAAQQAMTSVKEKRFTPDAQAHAVYDRLYAIYQELHDEFGNVANGNLGSVMKRLLEIRNQESAVRNQESGIRDQQSVVRNQEVG